MHVVVKIMMITTEKTSFRSIGMYVLLVLQLIKSSLKKRRCIVVIISLMNLLLLFNLQQVLKTRLLLLLCTCAMTKQSHQKEVGLLEKKHLYSRPASHHDYGVKSLPPPWPGLLASPRNIMICKRRKLL